MDVGKDKSHLKPHPTPDPHPQKTHAPEIIGTWNLRNREQLRKRKAEVQEKQTSQWLIGEQKKRKCQRTGKGNQRGQKRQRNIEPKLEPPSQIEQGTTEEELAPAEKETGPPVTETLLALASPRNVPKEHCSEIYQCQENSSKYQEIAVQNCSSQTYQHMAEPVDLSTNICQDTAVTQKCSSKVDQDMAELSPNRHHEAAMPQDHSSRAHQNMAEPEILFPKMCQEIAVLQEHPLKMCHDMTDPEVLSPKTGQEMAVPKAPPCIAPGDVAGPEGCSPEASPRSDVPEGCPLNTLPIPAGPEDFISKPEQGTVLPPTQISLSEDVSTKTHKEAIEPEYFLHETYKEITVPSHKTIQQTPGLEEYSPETSQQTPRPEKCTPETHQETPGPEEHSPEMYQEASGSENESPETYQEMPGPEDLSIKTCQPRDGPKDCLPETPQEADVPQSRDPDTPQEDVEDACAFSQDGDDIGRDPDTPQEDVEDACAFSQDGDDTEMKEKAKADQDPEIAINPHGP